MWTGRQLNTNFKTLHSIEVCCDTEKCDFYENSQAIDYIDELTVRCTDAEYSRFDMVAVKAVEVTNKDQIHIKILYLSEEQRSECLKDLLAWIRKYGSREVIEVAEKASLFLSVSFCG